MTTNLTMFTARNEKIIKDGSTNMLYVNTSDLNEKMDDCLEKTIDEVERRMLTGSCLSENYSDWDFMDLEDDGASIVQEDKPDADYGLQLDENNSDSSMSHTDEAPSDKDSLAKRGAAPSTTEIDNRILNDLEQQLFASSHEQRKQHRRLTPIGNDVMKSKIKTPAVALVSAYEEIDFLENAFGSTMKRCCSFASMSRSFTESSEHSEFSISDF